MRKDLTTLLGFILFLVGMLALVLSIISVQFAFLTFLDKPGRLFGFIVKIIMVITGVIMIVMANSPKEEDV